MNDIYVSYENEDESKIFSEIQVQRYLKAIFEELKMDENEISCSFVTDETIAKMNLDYRGVEGPTDILSFVQKDFNEDPESIEFVKVAEKAEKMVLGDLIISIDSLKRNCDYFNIKMDEELLRLLIHGVLHLIGEDHKTNEPDEPMLIRQEGLINHFKGRMF
ncbi:MAG: rRNA maturation RNase YbeY [Sphaerochaetaceae bacterium]